MNAQRIVILAEQELREAYRTRWFALIAAAFGGLVLVVSALGLAGLGRFGLTGFGRTAASLINLVVLMVPLMGLLMGALSVAPEREQGTLLTLMAQPVTPSEVLIAKFLGLSAALLGALLVGFGVSALVIAWGVGVKELLGYLTLVGLTALLALAHLAVGLGISVIARRQSTALGAALGAWLALAFLSDFGVMGTAMVLQLRPAQLLALALTNPAHVFKLAALHGMQGHLESLGAAGMYAASLLGPWLQPTMLALLAAWIVLPTWAAVWWFHRQGAL
jgi:Cu-processing system permease protein